MTVSVRTVRSEAQSNRIESRKATARDLIVQASSRPGSIKLVRAIAFFLLDQMAEMPGAEIRLEKAIEGLRLYANYKANRNHRRG